MLPKKALFIVLAVTLMVVKQPVSISIGDQQVDLNDPNASVNITLLGDSTSVPIIITYDDSPTRYLGYTFNYKPSVQPAPAFCSDADFATACWQGVKCQEENQGSADSSCSQNHGSGSRCTRSTGQPDTNDDGCTIVTEPPPPTAPPTPAPELSCGDFEYKYWECDWASQQLYDVYQDACGNYDRRDYRREPGQCGATSAYEPPAPSCDEDVYYCDNGTTIHKHGRYWDGNTCQYAFDPGDPC